MSTSPHPRELDELRRELIESLVALERADAPLDTLDKARQIREIAEQLELLAVSNARAEKVSWAKIGTSFKLTKQGAQQRFAASIAALASSEDAENSSTKPDPET